MPACISIHNKSEFKATTQTISVSCSLQLLIFGTILTAYISAEVDKIMLDQDIVEILRA